MLKNWTKKIKTKGEKNNRFYAPHLFKSIQNRLYMMPLWSSVMVGDWQDMTGKQLYKPRLTNNPIESYFKYLKHELLQRKKRSCSELMQITYSDLESKHKRLFAAPPAASETDEEM
jgi:hypothetical protein